MSSSKLFKKISDQNKEQTIETVSYEEEINPKNSIDVFMNDSFVTKKAPVIQEEFSENSDIFGDLTVDRAFTESTLKNAQKVKIFIIKFKVLFNLKILIDSANKGSYSSFDKKKAASLE